MQSFARPNIPADAPDWFKTYAEELHRAVLKGAQSSNDFALLKVLHAEPVRYFAGMEVYADGTDWNPGSGEGKYRRNSANSAWVFVG